MRHLPLSALLPLGIFAIAAWAQDAPAPPTLEETLKQVRAALGTADFPADHPGLRATGRIRQYGLDGGYELILDGQGRFRFVSSGPLGDMRSFDGTDAWITDWTKTTRHLMLRDRDFALTTVWLAAGWWAARPDLFELAVVPEKCSAKDVVLSLRRKLGQFRLDVTIDRGTWRPTGAKGKLRDQEHVIVFSGAMEGPGLKLPRNWTHTAGGVTGGVTLDKVETCAALPPETFRQKPARSARATFDAARPGALLCKKAISGHLLVKPTIGKEDVGWFIFDSGAGHMCIDKGLAQKLQLEAFGEIPVAGVGGVLRSRFCKSPSFELGPVTLKDATYIELDLKMIGRMLGEEVTGIVGYPLLQGATAEVDCHAPSIALHDPSSFKLPEGAAWTQLVLESNHPIVEGKYEGDRQGWFRLDTGAADSVSFHAPAVKRHKLLEGRKTQGTMQGGVGGMVMNRAGELEWFELAGHRFRQPRVTFAQSEKGAFADEYTDGNIGQDFLRPFVVVFDYGAERIAFVKKAKGKPAD